MVIYDVSVIQFFILTLQFLYNYGARQNHAFAVKHDLRKGESELSLYIIVG